MHYLSYRHSHQYHKIDKCHRPREDLVRCLVLRLALFCGRSVNSRVSCAVVVGSDVLLAGIGYVSLAVMSVSQCFLGPIAQIVMFPCHNLATRCADPYVLIIPVREAAAIIFI